MLCMLWYCKRIKSHAVRVSRLGYCIEGATETASAQRLQGLKHFPVATNTGFDALALCILLFEVIIWNLFPASSRCYCINQLGEQPIRS